MDQGGSGLIGTYPKLKFEHQDENPGHRSEHGDSCPPKEGPDSASPKLTEQSIHEAPTKITLLTRPVSSHQDPAAGFTFTKAKPVQHLDFNRRMSNTTLPPSTSVPSTTAQNRLPDRHCGLPNTQVSQATSISASNSSQAEISPKQPKPFAVPFPNVAVKVRQRPDDSVPSVTESEREKQSQPAVSTMNEVPMSGDDTLVNAEHNGIVPTEDHPMPKSAPSGHHLNGEVEQIPTAGQIRIPLNFTQHAIPPEGDLLQMLVFQHKQGEQERKMLQKKLQAKEAEYKELYAASEDLYGQLQDMSQRSSDNEAQLSKFKEAKSRYEGKIKRLTDYVQGLTNDHNRLRDDARAIREEQDSARQEKQAIFDTLREVYKTSEERHLKSKKEVMEARHDMNILAQTMSNQKSELRKEEADLASERERNNRLEEQIASFNVAQTRLLDAFAVQGDTITAKLTDLLQRSKPVEVTGLAALPDNLQPMLEQCVSMVKELPDTTSATRQADFEKLDHSVCGYFKEYVTLHIWAPC